MRVALRGCPRARWTQGMTFLPSRRAIVRRLHAVWACRRRQDEALSAAGAGERQPDDALARGPRSPRTAALSTADGSAHTRCVGSEACDVAHPAGSER
jgi:hypothetical protein